MARSLSHALNKTTGATPNPRLLHSRNRSTFPEPPAIYHGYKADKDSDADAVHRIIVKKSQPDWHPLRPGFSYWAPPKSNSAGFSPNSPISVSLQDPAMEIADHFFKGEAASTNTTPSKVDDDC